MKRLRIGTRGSSLALWQANHIAELLAQRHGIETELVRIRTVRRSSAIRIRRPSQ